MPNGGWCSASLSSMCGEGVSDSMQQHVMVDFGAEAVVEAIGIAAGNNGNYLSGYAVEYARLDMQFFNAIDESSNTTVCSSYVANTFHVLISTLKIFQVPYHLDNGCRFG